MQQAINDVRASATECWIMHTISAPSAGFAQLMPPVFE
jgi:hypothetical protein